ncbi:uncharacterized protein F5891DRAFT_1194650 [Suillus fuscotomentosus]|uniref:Uncharacterized protein n=1 Tax=Suillus fuscotomentosus TaxID=1912939 RepID=A0AAD4DVR4_9AGAM|nr:uncharacterized protein F5891DRAFT_1194650 [Suillus fuscotomentosus]KAG1894984.1 hypothetical protein F5891DRAFT_1194650 [Suillus fuscotomentosus]
MLHASTANSSAIARTFTTAGMADVDVEPTTKPNNIMQPSQTSHLPATETEISTPHQAMTLRNTCQKRPISPTSLPVQPLKKQRKMPKSHAILSDTEDKEDQLMKDQEVITVAVRNVKGKARAKDETEDTDTKGRPVLPTIIMTKASETSTSSQLPKRAWDCAGCLQAEVPCLPGIGKRSKKPISTCTCCHKSKLKCRPLIDNAGSKPANTTSQPEIAGKCVTRSTSNAKTTKSTTTSAHTHASALMDAPTPLGSSSAAGPTDTLELSPCVTDCLTSKTADNAFTIAEGNTMPMPYTPVNQTVSLPDHDQVMENTTAEARMTCEVAATSEVAGTTIVDGMAEQRIARLEQQVALLDQATRLQKIELDTTRASLNGLCHAHIPDNPMFPAPTSSRSDITLPPAGGWQQVTDEIINSVIFGSLSHQLQNWPEPGPSAMPGDSISAIMGVAGEMVSPERQWEADLLAQQDVIAGGTDGSESQVTQTLVHSPEVQSITSHLFGASVTPGMAAVQEPLTGGLSELVKGLTVGENFPGRSDSDQQVSTHQ